MATKKKSAVRKRSTGLRAGRTTRVAAPRRSAAKMTTRKSVGSAPSARKKPLEIGGMTVREAGRKGGLIGGKKGGETVKRERGIEFFVEIGRMGGQRVRDLIAAGRKATERPSRRRHT